MLSASFPSARPAVSLLVALLLLVAPARTLARRQQQQQPAQPPPAATEEEVVRVNAELVQTDVMVFDREGRFVDGLRPEQFSLKVDGVAQDVAFFERIEAGAVNEDAQLAAARGGVRTASSSRAGAAALPLDRGRTVGFFVDDLHLSAEGAARTRRALARFVEEELGQNDVAAVASASGQVGFLQQFTDNKAVMRAAVGRLGPRAGASRDFERPPMSVTQAFAVERNDTGVVNAFVEAMVREDPLLRREMAASLVASRARGIAQQSNQVASHTLQSLESFVRGAAPLPGRKVVFFISEGFVLDARDGQVRERLRRVTDAAARASVVVYSMDAQGLRTGAPDASAQPVFDPTMTLSSHDLGDVSSYQAPLHTLAAETGGRALVNTNALVPGVKGVLKETSKYYLLAWRPAEGGGREVPKYRRVEVAVKDRPELRVLVRRGFYSTPPPEAAPGQKKSKGRPKQEAPVARGRLSDAERDMQAALFSQHPRTDLPTALSLGYADMAEAGMVITSSVELGRDAVAPPGAGDGGRMRFDLVGAIYDDRGKAVNVFNQEISYARPQGAADERARVVASNQTPVAPGLYQVRVAARDPKTGRVGSASQWLEVPDLTKGPFALSSIFVAERASGAGADKLTPEEVERRVLVSAGRRLARSSWMRFLTYIYSRPAAGSRPDLALQVQIFRDDQPVFTAPLRKVSIEGLPDLTRVPYAAELALGDFPAGRYALQLTAIDRASKKTATQRVSFTIE